MMETRDLTRTPRGTAAARGSVRLRLALVIALLSEAAPLSYADGVRFNLKEHAAERATSGELGFQQAAAAVPAVRATSLRIDRRHLGMGSACPFDSDELVFQSEPIFSPSECCAVRDEAAELIASGARSSFTMTVRWHSGAIANAIG